MTMASEQSAPTNGTFGSHQSQSFTASEQASTTATTASNASSNPAEIPKDEVGWYFVEQYYTTLSRTPDKLYLFYNKRSQFVYGEEEEKVTVSVGKEKINDRILSLDFVDSKVRITNVDSQGADQHIVIQVIGEISNKNQPPRKFVQTFILASQRDGYFVLNDIFRYIAEDEIEEEEEEAAIEHPASAGGTQEPAPTATESAGESLTNDADPSVREADAGKVDKELEEVPKTESGVAQDIVSDSPAQVNGAAAPDSAKIEEAEDAPAAAIIAEEKPKAQTEEPAVEETKEPEKPKEPEQVKPAPSKAAAPAVPAGPPRPVIPKTWANLAAAANRVATPVVQTAAAAATSTAKAAVAALPSVPTAPAAASKDAPSAPAAAEQREASPATSGHGSASGWQTAGADHSKRQSRIVNPTAPANESQEIRAYIKNVFDAVDEDALKKELTKYGEITYFDLSRQRNCAFVNFATRAAFEAAVSANPHKIGDETIVVDERRQRPGPGSFRGGPQRGRGDGRPAGPGRGGFQRDSGRGGFPARGRGAPQAARGRGAAPTA